MRAVLALILLLLGCDMPTPVMALKLDPVRSSVGVLVFGDHACSAVLIAPRIAVTAGHCVTVGAAELSGAVFIDGYAKPRALVMAAFASDIADAGVLVLDRAAGPGLPLETKLPNPGDRLTLVGYGCDGHMSMSMAELIGQRDIDGQMYYLGHTCKGDSGGAVLDSRGALVGIMVGYWAENHRVGFSTPTKDLLTLLLGMDLP